METLGDTEPKIQEPEVDLFHEFVPDSDVEDGLGRVVIEGPIYPNIDCVKINFSLDMMMGVYCPKYKDVLMKVVPGFLATVEESKVEEVESVTYTYVGDLRESITKGLPELSSSEDLNDADGDCVEEEDDFDDDADVYNCREDEDEGRYDEGRGSCDFLGSE